MREQQSSGGRRDERDTLPEVCAIKITDHPNPRMTDALSHVVRRRLLRAIQEYEPPCSVRDLARTPALDGESASVLSYHADVLKECAALSLSGELVRPTGFQSLYTSNVADDELVLWVLQETAAMDARR